MKIQSMSHREHNLLQLQRLISELCVGKWGLITVYDTREHIMRVNVSVLLLNLAENAAKSEH
jgi:hypothetical protein